MMYLLYPLSYLINLREIDNLLMIKLYYYRTYCAIVFHIFIINIFIEMLVSKEIKKEKVCLSNCIL